MLVCTDDEEVNAALGLCAQVLVAVAKVIDVKLRSAYRCPSAPSCHYLALNLTAFVRLNGGTLLRAHWHYLLTYHPNSRLRWPCTRFARRPRCWPFSLTSELALLLLLTILPLPRGLLLQTA